MLEVRSVSKYFGGAEAVSGVSMRVAEGDIAGLIGPNGAGITTLFNLITGHLQPTAGAIIMRASCPPPITPTRTRAPSAASVGPTVVTPRSV